MMTFLVVLLTHLLMLLPIYGEAAFDKIMWNLGFEDKPISTWVVRPMLFIIGGFTAWMLDDKELWRVALVMGAAFAALFPLLINWVLGKPIGYLSKGNWYDRLMGKIKPDIMRIWLLIWLYITMLCVYYYYELYYNLIL